MKTTHTLATALKVSREISAVSTSPKKVKLLTSGKKEIHHRGQHFKRIQAPIQIQIEINTVMYENSISHIQ